jgi:hypothetical protein
VWTRAAVRQHLTSGKPVTGVRLSTGLLYLVVLQQGGLDLHMTMVASCKQNGACRVQRKLLAVCAASCACPGRGKRPRLWHNRNVLPAAAAGEVREVLLLQVGVGEASCTPTPPTTTTTMVLLMTWTLRWRH